MLMDKVGLPVLQGNLKVPRNDMGHAFCCVLDLFALNLKGPRGVKKSTSALSAPRSARVRSRPWPHSGCGGPEESRQLNHSQGVSSERTRGLAGPICAGDCGGAPRSPDPLLLVSPEGLPMTQTIKIKVGLSIYIQEGTGKVGKDHRQSLTPGWEMEPSPGLQRAGPGGCCDPRSLLERGRVQAHGHSRGPASRPAGAGCSNVQSRVGRIRSGP